MSQNELASIIETLQGDNCLLPQHMTFVLGKCRITLRSNSDALLKRLDYYFEHLPRDSQPSDIEVIAIEREPLELTTSFRDWKREAGKSGRKDSVYDLPEARLLRKTKTGMVFLQSKQHRIAAGPCLQNDNQIINFINAQYMNWLQHRGWLICHASALVKNNHALAIAGFSGGGKSTLMLQLLEDPEIKFLSNDRLFISDAADHPLAAGIPKLPRINPGTIVHNVRLHPLINQQRREQLLTLPADELWELEEKYDVMIDELYGPNRTTPQAQLYGFVILSWDRKSCQPTQVSKIDLEKRQALLKAVIKCPGPFYQDGLGLFQNNATSPDAASYLKMLEQVSIYEITGKVDFVTAVKQLNDILDR